MATCYVIKKYSQIIKIINSIYLFLKLSYLELLNSLCSQRCSDISAQTKKNPAGLWPAGFWVMKEFKFLNQFTD